MRLPARAAGLVQAVTSPPALGLRPKISGAFGPSVFRLVGRPDHDAAGLTLGVTNWDGLQRTSDQLA